MSNLFLVARQEYLKKVSQKGFWLASLSVPLLIIVAMAVAILVAVKADQTDPIGYIDQAGVIVPEAWQPDPDSGEHIEIISYADETTAKAALEGGEIQGYYVIPPDYLDRRELSFYYKDETPGEQQKDDFNSFLRASLAADSAETAREVLEDGPALTVRSMDGSKEIIQGNVFGILLPFAAGIILIITNMTAAGTLLQVVADEKENRTIEVLITSISPEQLIGGKVVGLMAVAFTQMTLWIAAVAIGVLVAGSFFEEIRGMQLPLDFLLLAVVFFVPTFALIAGIMTAIGGSVTETTQGQQIAGVINLVFMVPLLLSSLIIFSPNSPFVVFLTLFPTTAFATIVLRWGFAVIPTWELIVSWLALMGGAVFSVWASARIFRMGMLRYGNALDLRTAVSGLGAELKRLVGVKP